MKKNKVGILLGSLVLLIIVFFTIVQPKIITYQKEVEKAKVYQSGIELIKQGKWLEAERVFDPLRSWSIPYKNVFELYSYANIRHSRTVVADHFGSLLESIPNDYSGDLANEILSYKAQLEKEYAVYKKEDNDKYSLSSSTQALTPSTPRVGMTASEMSASTWGIPKDKNRTTTADGVSEQWVYSSNKYVYLDDGIVTAIQD